MYHKELKKNEKDLYKMMKDQKLRFERRQEYQASKLADPFQLIRLTGQAVKLHNDNDQYNFHENENNLMRLPFEPETLIDRFDCRLLLDFLPNSTASNGAEEKDENQQAILNESYKDLINQERLNNTPEECIEQIDEEWNQSLLKKKKKKPKDDDDSDEQDEPIDGSFLRITNIVENINLLTESDIKQLNNIAKEYSINNHYRFLRSEKRTINDEEERAKQAEIKRLAKKQRKKERKDRKNGKNVEVKNCIVGLGKKHKVVVNKESRGSPTYDAYEDSGSDSSVSSSSSSNSSKISQQKEEFISEFGKTQSASSSSEEDEEIHEIKETIRKPSIPIPVKPLTNPAPMTGAERLKMMSRMALNKTIEQDLNKSVQLKAKKQQEEVVKKLLMDDARKVAVKSQSTSKNEAIRASDARDNRERSRSKSRDCKRSRSREYNRRSRSMERKRSRSRERKRRSRSRSRDNVNSKRDRSRSRDYRRRNRSRSPGYKRRHHSRSRSRR